MGRLVKRFRTCGRVSTGIEVGGKGKLICRWQEAWGMTVVGKLQLRDARNAQLPVALGVAVQEQWRCTTHWPVAGTVVYTTWYDLKSLM